jgi:hypothetical protein
MALAAFMEFSWRQCDQTTAGAMIGRDRKWLLGHRSQAVDVGDTLNALGGSPPSRPLDVVYDEPRNGILARTMIVKMKLP